jgi:TetR/AcrR family transcriptional repressor of nem operon
LRKSREAAAETKAAIIASATTAFKRNGFTGIGMADLMARQGLTHAAAYRHFRNKNALAATCLQHATAASVARTARAKTLKTWKTRYLAPDRVEDPAAGCAFAALAVDVARAQDPTLHHTFTEGLTALAKSLATATEIPNDEALRQIAQAAGALILMRAAPTLAATLRTACLNS